MVTFGFLVPILDISFLSLVTMDSAPNIGCFCEKAIQYCLLLVPSKSKHWDLPFFLLFCCLSCLFASQVRKAHFFFSFSSPTEPTVHPVYPHKGWSSGGRKKPQLPDVVPSLEAISGYIWMWPKEPQKFFTKHKRWRSDTIFHPCWLPSSLWLLLVCSLPLQNG